ncbi:MAG: hypothetical protein HOP21_07700 [Methylotenera sp.]|nr:hypothetical protein [Methylotenera sp.]
MKFNISHLIASLLVGSALFLPSISNAATGTVEILNIQDNQSCSHTCRVQNMACIQAIKEVLRTGRVIDPQEFDMPNGCNASVAQGATACICVSNPDWSGN